MNNSYLPNNLQGGVLGFVTAIIGKFITGIFTLVTIASLGEAFLYGAVGTIAGILVTNIVKYIKKLKK